MAMGRMSCLVILRILLVTADFSSVMNIEEREKVRILERRGKTSISF